MPNPDVRLVFDFALREDEAPSRLVLTHPLSVHTAHTLAEVPAVLRAAEVAARNGLYAAGFVSYEAAPAFDSSLVVRDGMPGLPLAWFAVFSPPAPIGGAAYAAGGNVPLHPSIFSLSVGGADSHRENTKSSGMLVPTDSAPPMGAGGEKQKQSWTTDTTQPEWNDGIAAIHDAIARGETYQVNYSRRLCASIEGDAFALYERLRKAQSGTKYAAYLETGRFRVVSVSPELFFATRAREIVTRPMKGTARRGRWGEEDLERAEQLKGSEKERAENVMVVDLLRNDVGRIARVGSVRVPELFTVERYPTVLQMTSEVRAELADGVGLGEIFGALFPSGSVTGAPKVQTMRHIAVLERAPRGVYCGAVGLILPGGDAVFNVAIRTLVVDGDTGVAEYGVGGGITWGSTAEGEWRETEAKAAVLDAEVPPGFELLETLRLENGDYFLRERHVQRVYASAAYFGRPCEESAVRDALDTFAVAHSEGAWRVRLRVDENGIYQVEGTPLSGALSDFGIGTSPMPVVLAQSAVSSQDVFLCHKTTHRAVYEMHRTEMPEGAFDVLLWNEAGEVTEFTIGNLVAEIEGECWTPLRTCGLLNGTLRADLLERGIIQERVLRVDDIYRATRLWLVNSVRGCVPVSLTERTKRTDGSGG
jgi:para-aminobenzoate synthetase/4-amino-4-deoxychorismate lyase